MVRIKDVADNWCCPVCEKTKQELIHKRKNGCWFSGVEDHHYGRSPEDYNNYLKSNTVRICYLCNSKESRVRKFFKIKNAMCVSEMKYFFNEYGKIKK